jgi:aryl carrier-like protein
MTSAEISALMQEILQVNEVAVDDNFFELGGNSVHVLTLISRIKEKSGADVSLLDVIYAPTADAIAQSIRRSNPE